MGVMVKRWMMMLQKITYDEFSGLKEGVMHQSTEWFNANKQKGSGPLNLTLTIDSPLQTNQANCMSKSDQTD